MLIYQTEHFDHSKSKLKLKFSQKIHPSGSYSSFLKIKKAIPTFQWPGPLEAVIEYSKQNMLILYCSVGTDFISVSHSNSRNSFKQFKPTYR